MSIDPNFANLEAVDAYAIAINLAYLNLPNLRFADLIKSRIRTRLNSVAPTAYDQALTHDPAYRSIYEAGGLDEIRGVRAPDTEERADGDVRTRGFMLIWCTPILLGKSIVPFDKVVASVLLTLSSIYMYVIAAAKLGSDPADVAALARLLVVFVAIPAVCLFIYLAIVHDAPSAVTAILTGAYMLYAFYTPGGLLSFPIGDPHWALLLLASSVGITTLFVLVSFGLYRHAEHHYESETTRVFRARRG